jgi:hypothetical protein
MRDQSDPAVAPTVAELIARHRAERRLSFGDVARLLDARTPRQASKMSQRIVLIERGGRIVERRLISRLGVVLEIDNTELERAFDDQRAVDLREWVRWLNEPVPMKLHLRAMPGVWFLDRLPVVGQEEAIRFAGCVAAKRKLYACLSLNRQISVWFDKEGEETARTVAMPSSTRQLLMTRLK